jgi:hypothetical protein
MNLEFFNIKLILNLEINMKKKNIKGCNPLNIRFKFGKKMCLLIKKDF